MTNEERKKFYQGDDVVPAPLMVGRKQIKIDLDQLKALAKLRPSISDVASFFRIDENTVNRIIKREFGKSFSLFIEEQFVHTKSALLRKALSEAMKDDPNTKMLDLCLKNFCGWRDKIDNDIHAQIAVAHAPTVVFAVNDNDEDE